MQTKLLEKAEYNNFISVFRNNFRKKLETADSCIFTVSTEGLWDAYITTFASSTEDILSNDCNYCRDFINKYGGLVYVNYVGKLTSLLWSADNIPEKYLRAFLKLKNMVINRPIENIFFTSKTKLGKFTDLHNDSEWGHLSVDLTGIKTPCVVKNAAKNRRLAKTIYSLYCQTQDIVADENIVKEVHKIHNEHNSTGFMTQFTQDLKIIDILFYITKHYTSGHACCNIKWHLVGKTFYGDKAVKQDKASTMLALLLLLTSRHKEKDLTIWLDKNMHYTQMNIISENRKLSKLNLTEFKKTVDLLGLEKSFSRRMATKTDFDKFIWCKKDTIKPKNHYLSYFDHTPITYRDRREMFSDDITLADLIALVDTDENAILELGIMSFIAPIAITTAVYPEAPPILFWDSFDKRKTKLALGFTSYENPTNVSLRPVSWQPISYILSLSEIGCYEAEKTYDFSGYFIGLENLQLQYQHVTSLNTTVCINELEEYERILEHISVFSKVEPVDNPALGIMFRKSHGHDTIVIKITSKAVNGVFSVRA